VELLVTSCTLDGKAVIGADLDAHLVELDVPWARATLALTVAVSSATLADVAGGALPGAFEIAIITRCPSTFLRVARRVALTALDEPLPVNLELARDDLAGPVSLGAFLVRVTDANGDSHSVVRGARVADSRSWELRVDRHREPRGDYLDVRYKKFSDDETLPRRNRGNLYVLEADHEAPILWINADHERVAATLDSRGTAGRHARLRESFFDHIAYAVWTQLFFQAASDYVPDGEATYPWQDVVLDLLLKDVFPNQHDSSARRDELREMFKQPALLMQRLDAGLQRRNDLAGHLTKLVNEEDET
jgi:hypothetical protein